MKYFLYSCLVVSIFVHASFVSAQSSCSIVVSEDESTYGYLPEFITNPIADCNNPFDLTDELPMPYTLEVDGETYDTGATIITDDGTLSLPLHFRGSPTYSDVWTFLFKHNGTTYELLNQESIELPPPSEEEVREYGEMYFDTDRAVDLYTEIYFSEDQGSYFEDENGEDILDEETGEDVRNRFYGFSEFVYEERIIPPTPIEPGVYTFVFDESETILTQESLWQKVRGLFIKTALAQYIPPPRRFAITFTLEAVEPEGASSVLFLPGIQGSRLYKDGLFGTEDRVWEPNGNQDIGQLAMSETGVSVNNIYTRDIIAKAYGLADIYAGFGSFMTNLVADGIIKDWTPFAYDWRYSVVDVANNGTQYENEVRDIVTEIEYLAGDSLSGKVTIIGHSNGGLVAKAIMQRLEQEGKTSLVDKVIFLASPQLGTPLAIGSILHGYEQEKISGLLMDDSIVRSVSVNFPGAYGLLPTQKYFNVAPGLVTLFDNSVSTQLFRAAYGNSIGSEAELKSFMVGQQDGRLEATTVNEASLANNLMISEAFEQHTSVLDAWTAPDGVEVIEVVGVGLNTVSGFQYTEFTERICGEPDVFGQQECDTQQIYKPKPFISQYGDKTVMGQSAEGYEDEKETYYVNLLAIKQNEEDIEHGNFTEHSSIQKLLKNILEHATTDIEFISQTKTTFDMDRVLLGTHSPVTMAVIDSEGRKVGVEYVGSEQVPQLVEEVPGSSYFEIGGSTYVVLPAELTYDVILKGTGEGGLTFTLDTLDGDLQTSLISVAVATITASTTIKVTYNNKILSNFFIDTNNDGETDIVMTPDGEIVPPLVTYDMLRKSVSDLSLSNSWKKPLQILVTAAEAFDKKSRTNVKYTQLEIFTLNQLETLIKLYVKRGLLTKLQIEEVIKIIKLLKL